MTEAGEPAKFEAARHPKTEASDPLRDTVDELLLHDTYNMRKPILGICYGLQILNVYRSGNLLQHIESTVNHEAGRKVPVAHRVTIAGKSLLAEIVLKDKALSIPVNSSHHQAAGDTIGDGLRIVARCPEDSIIEAIEGKIVFQRCQFDEPPCDHVGGCALCGLFEQAQDGVKDVLSRTTLHDLLQRHEKTDATRHLVKKAKAKLN